MNIIRGLIQFINSKKVQALTKLIVIALFIVAIVKSNDKQKSCQPDPKYYDAVVVKLPQNGSYAVIYTQNSSKFIADNNYSTIYNKTTMGNCLLFSSNNSDNTQLYSSSIYKIFNMVGENSTVSASATNDFANFMSNINFAWSLSFIFSIIMLIKNSIDLYLLSKDKSIYGYVKKFADDIRDCLCGTIIKISFLIIFTSADILADLGFMYADELQLGGNCVSFDHPNFLLVFRVAIGFYSSLIIVFILIILIICGIESNWILYLFLIMFTIMLGLGCYLIYIKYIYIDIPNHLEMISLTLPKDIFVFISSSLSAISAWLKTRL